MNTRKGAWKIINSVANIILLAYALGLMFELYPPKMSIISAFIILILVEVERIEERVNY